MNQTSGSCQPDRFYSNEPTEAGRAVISVYRNIFSELAYNIERDAKTFNYKEECLKHLELAHMYLNKDLTSR